MNPGGGVSSWSDIDGLRARDALNSVSSGVLLMPSFLPTTASLSVGKQLKIVALLHSFRSIHFTICHHSHWTLKLRDPTDMEYHSCEHAAKRHVPCSFEHHIADLLQYRANRMQMLDYVGTLRQ